METGEYTLPGTRIKLGNKDVEAAIVLGKKASRSLVHVFRAWIAYQHTYPTLRGLAYCWLEAEGMKGCPAKCIALRLDSWVVGGVEAGLLEPRQEESSFRELCKDWGKRRELSEDFWVWLEQGCPSGLEKPLASRPGQTTLDNLLMFV
jgi:hypothetical protein